MKILLVEDQKDLREILEKRLKKEYSVDSCEDGEEALDFLSVYSYDIVLLDIMLPKLDGFGVCEQLRRQSQVPILMLTALDGEEEQLRGFG